MEKFPWWTDSQKKLADEVDEFADKITPQAQELVWKREYPWELVREVAKKGWFGAIIPEEYGGKRSERGVTGSCIVSEGLSRAGAVVYPYVLTMCGGTHQIEEFALEEKKKEWLPKIAKGEMIGAVALTEPYVGSDAASIETTAIREGDEYVINGKKRFITNAAAANMYMLYARTSDKPEYKKKYGHISAFIVEKGTPGFTVEKMNELIGFDNMYNAYLNFEDVRIPVDNRLGGEGEGWRVMMSGLNFERTLSAASTLGWMREALRYAIFHMQRRIQFGQPTINLPTNQFKVADMMCTFNTARLLTYYAAYLLDLGQEAAAYASIAKLYNTDKGMEMFIEATQCMGGDGVTRFYPVESLIRDTKIVHIAAGTNEVMRLIIYGMGLRALEKDLKPPIRKVHEELNVPISVGFAGVQMEKKIIEKEDDLLDVLAENYKVNPGLYMNSEDLKGVLEVSDEDINKFLTALEEKGLVDLYRGRKGEIRLARATYEGLRKAKPKEEYRWFPEWVKKEDIF
jgi:alkylation response protein AidB-like acyl-CoA dehydrogenase